MCVGREGYFPQGIISTSEKKIETSLYGVIKKYVLINQNAKCS